MEIQSNKNIVYSDVFPLKDINNNLIVTKIENVNEYDLENCLNSIFIENNQATFNTIQYSRKNKTVYFYTNEKISVDSYENFRKYESTRPQAMILEEIQRVLESEDNNDDKCISLYDILLLLRNLEAEYDNMHKYFTNNLNRIVKNVFYKDSRIIIYRSCLDFCNNLLDIGFAKHAHYDLKSIYFTKRHGILYVTKSESPYTKEVLNALYPQLSIIYDKYLNYSDYTYYENSKYHIHPVNSIFEIHISHLGINICFDKNDYLRDYLDLYVPSYKSNYKIKSEYNIVKEYIAGKENEILKRIFVNISDCPIWCQKQLLEIRKEQLEMKQKQLELKQKQLDELKKRQEEIKYKEMKKQKRLTLIKRYFLL